MTTTTVTCTQARPTLVLRLHSSQVSHARGKALIGRLITVLEKHKTNNDPLSEKLYTWALSACDELQEGEHGAFFETVIAKMPDLLALLTDPVTGHLFQEPLLIQNRVWEKKILILCKKNPDVYSQFHTKNYFEKVHDFAIDMLGIAKEICPFPEEKPLSDALIIAKLQCEVLRDPKFFAESAARIAEAERIAKGLKDSEVEAICQRIRDLSDHFAKIMDTLQSQHEEEIARLRKELDALQTDLAAAINLGAEQGKKIEELKYKVKELEQRVANCEADGGGCVIC